MHKAFVYRPYPSKPQAHLLDATLETCRRFYNQCLAERKQVWEEEQRTLGKFEQLRNVKTLKATNPSAKSVHSHVLQTVVQDLDRTFQAFFRRVTSGAAKPGSPRFKGRNRFRSFGFKELGNGFKIDGRRLKLSGIGRVAVRWHRPLEGVIKTVRIIKKAGKWYACFSCEVARTESLPKTEQAIGIDVGLAHLYTISDGEQVENPRWY
jgi:putative transposase